MHKCIDVMIVKYVHSIPRSVCNRNKSRQVLQINTIFLTDYYHDYTLDGIGCREKLSMKEKLVLKMKNNKSFFCFNKGFLFDFYN